MKAGRSSPLRFQADTDYTGIFVLARQLVILSLALLCYKVGQDSSCAPVLTGAAAGRTEVLRGLKPAPQRFRTGCSFYNTVLVGRIELADPDIAVPHGLRMILEAERLFGRVRLVGTYLSPDGGPEEILVVLHQHAVE